MTTEEKVALVKGVCEACGLSCALSAVELPRATWYYHRKEKMSYEAKHAHLRPLLEAIAREHPVHGYRRTTVELRRRYGLEVKHKVIQRP